MEKKEGKKCCLVVIDGWGENEEENKEIVDGIEKAKPEFMRSIARTYYSTLLYAHGMHVGLASDSLMGNSEVGHLTIGAGRVVEQDSVRIRKALTENPEKATAKLFKTESRESVHLLGILSDGGIHGNWEDIRDIANRASACSKIVYVHTISDGRDTRPAEYLKYLQLLEESTPSNVWIVSVSGRFYAMDRDRREERTDRAYREITEITQSDRIDRADKKIAQSEGTDRAEQYITRESCLTAIRDHVNRSYEKNETDEFITPFITTGRIKQNEPVLVTNFRVDRVKQIYSKLEKTTEVYSMTRVCKEQSTERVLFERPEVENTVGDILEENRKTQARIAETEKKAHVTFFFDGGKEKQRSRETRIIHPSKKVETYDLVPEMSAHEITQSVCAEMEKGTDFILANLANCDMVGHTGSVEATVKAVQEVDRSIERIYSSAEKHRYALVVTADHGNAEIMADRKGTVKSHTTNRVPVIVIQEYREIEEKGANRYAQDGYTDTKEEWSLSSIGPTVLEIMNLEIPKEMTGRSLAEKEKELKK